MTLHTRLSALNFFQNALYASTVIALGTYLLQTLSFSGREVGLVYATAAIAATLAPPVTGWLADRRFSVDRMLVWLNLLAALAVAGLFFVDSFPLFYGLFLVFNLCFMPTFSLLASTCFHMLEEPSREYPLVRMWGTVGFMLFGISLSVLAWEPTPWPLVSTGVMAVLMALLAWGLPPVPPQPGFSWADLKGEEVGRIIREPGMLILFLCMFLSCIPSSFYYSFVNPFLTEIGWSYPSAKMSLGQLTEIILLLTAPFVLRKLRFRRILFWGFFLWGARYFAFAFARPGHLEWLLYLGIVVQGFVFVWIVVAAQLYIDKRVPKGLRSTAQGLITMANQGVGVILGSWIAGEVVNANLVETFGQDYVVRFFHDWATIWLVPGSIGIVTALIFWAFFPRTGKL